MQSVQEWLLLIAPDKTHFLINRAVKKISTHFGQIDLSKIKNSKVKSSKGVVFSVTKPSFIDFFKKLSRGPAVILPKDAAAILINTGLGPGCKVIEIGTGSGWLTAHIAHIIGEGGKVITYECQPKFAAIAQSNFKILGLKNIEIKVENAFEANFKKYKDFADLFVVDLPNPEKILKKAKIALKKGGWFVAYLPQITQVIELAKALKNNFKKDFILEKVSEVFEREWHIDLPVARPQHNALSHTAFLLFARKI